MNPKTWKTFNCDPEFCENCNKRNDHKVDWPFSRLSRSCLQKNEFLDVHFNSINIANGVETQLKTEISNFQIHILSSRRLVTLFRSLEDLIRTATAKRQNVYIRKSRQTAKVTCNFINWMPLLFEDRTIQSRTYKVYSFERYELNL